MTDTARLEQQVAFLMEAERLRTIQRATPIGDGSRPENSAEHSWHLALFAMVLGEHGPDGVDLTRVIKMLILHDIVEIDAGDHPVHGHVDKEAVKAAENAAATRLYGLLPDDQAAELRAIWDEYEAAQSPEAVFAKALDRFQPPLLNLATGGVSWAEYNVTPEQVDQRVGTAVRRGAPGLWAYIWPRITAFFAAKS